MINVLVVEDEPPILKNICRNIERAHEQFKIVGTAYDGQEALNYLKENHEGVDVLITDIHMPVMSGIELLEHVAEEYPEMVTLVLSGYQDFNYAKKAFKSGIFDYLLKPVDKKNLRNQLIAVAEHLKTSRSEKIYSLLSDIFIRNDNMQTLEKFRGDQYVRILLFCAGPFPLSDYDLLLPGRSFWEQNSLIDYASRYFSRMENWVIQGKSTAEQILFIFSENPVKESYINNLYWALSQIGTIPITLCWSPSLQDCSSLIKDLNKMRVSIQNNLIFSRSSITPYSYDSSPRE